MQALTPSAHRSIWIAVLLSACMINIDIQAFSPVITAAVVRKNNDREKAITSLFLSRDEFMQPHFEVKSDQKTKKVKAYDFDYNRIVECANSDACSVDEMYQMMEELQELEGSSSGGGTGGYGAFQSSVDDPALHALSHALQSRVELVEAQQELQQVGLATTTAATETSSTDENGLLRDTTPTLPERSIQDLIHQMRDIAEHEEH